ncbi:MAG TPA: CAP domain-containing protein [Actinomycetota bacterium]|nr:CAP domain-containing protein [Actinomycetota bacterium]
MNEVREKAGLGPLERGHRVSIREEGHAWRMARKGRLWHADLPRLLDGVAWERAGEVVGAATGPHRLVRAWLRSPEHRAVIFGPYRRLGIGAHRSGGFLWSALVVWR